MAAILGGDDGDAVGEFDRDSEGVILGENDGSRDGNKMGAILGDDEGDALGEFEGDSGGDVLTYLEIWMETRKETSSAIMTVDWMAPNWTPYLVTMMETYFEIPMET